jgi:large subunit ribosomal protein L21
MFAVIKSGGRQYKVSVGQKFPIDRLAIEDGTQIRIEEVFLISDADQTLVGTPFVTNAAVLATVMQQMRGPKLTVFKYKSKKRYRHKRGHRQDLTLLRIDDILAEGKSLISGKAPEEKEVPVAPVVAEVSSPVTETPEEE